MIRKIIFYKNSYEEEQIKFIKNYIDKNKIDIFIDIGSNIGIYSLIISKNFKKISNSVENIFNEIFETKYIIIENNTGDNIFKCLKSDFELKTNRDQIIELKNWYQ